MKRIYVTDENGQEWVRVTKNTARKLYNAGMEVCFCPCKMHPFGFWNCGVVVHSGFDFTKLVNGYEFYNCNLNEVGKYTAFYVKAEEKL